MAIEVTCGQCHGRLLVETPGGVVACPHCGVHLAIPAPEPDSATQPETMPALERDTAIEMQPAPGSPPAVDDPGDIELNLDRAEQLAAESAANVPVDPLNSSSVFGGPDEHQHDEETGWHSAPNLHLGQSESPDIGTGGTEPSPALFTSPLMDRSPDPAPDSVRGQALAMFPAFGEPPRPTALEWNFTPGEAATSAPDDVFLSSSQQFTLGAPADEPIEEPEQPTFLMGAPADSASDAALARTIALPGDEPAELALSSSQQFSLGAAVATSPATDAGATASTGDSETPSGFNSAAPPTVLDAAVARTSAPAAAQQKSLALLLLVVGSYASAVTIALIYLLIVGGRTHPLESLPDVKPPAKKGDATVTDYVSPKNDLPPGHVLKLGQSQRFGSVRVTPVKVTRGTVKFKPLSETSALQLFDTEPLLKLWLKFENVSDDQTFSPLDELLVFKRSKQTRGKKVFSNNFLVAAENRKQAQSLFRVYDLPTDSDFAMIGQKLNTDVAPGKTWETFVPSEEDAVELKGELVWRVHIRKGYHPESHRGVTTLIDVRFNSSDISNDS